MVVEHQDRGASEELPIAVQDGRGDIEFRNLLRMAAAKLSEHGVLAHETVSNLSHIWIFSPEFTVLIKGNFVTALFFGYVGMAVVKLFPVVRSALV